MSTFPVVNMRIIPPSEFKTLAWKNGLGETIELAINEGGTLVEFDWRISMASVIEDGEFSNFSGYTRNLVLIEGNGINLQHNDNKIDKLSHILDRTTFDGDNKTIGNLHAGDITNFNVITRAKTIKVEVNTHNKLVNHPLKKAELCFVYSLYRDAKLQMADNEQVFTLPAGHLLQISNVCNKITHDVAQLSGTHLIIVYLHNK